MEKVFKSISGWKPEDGKHIGTHILLSNDEYNKLLQAIQDAETGKTRAENRASEKIRNVKDEAKEAIQLVQKNIEELKMEKQQLHEMVNGLKEQLQYEQGLNDNFCRISRERANKARGLNKHEKGYLFFNWQPFFFKKICIKSGKKEVIEYNLYRVKMQTPWDCSLSEKEIDRLVMGDIEKGNLIISHKEIKWYINNLSLDSVLDKKENVSDFILSRQYNANGKTGLWELTLITGFEPLIEKKHRMKYV